MTKRKNVKEKYSSQTTVQTWYCLNCDKGGSGGHFPALAHRRATGHRVMVAQKSEYLYG